MGTSLYRSLLLSTGGFTVSDYVQKFTINDSSEDKTVKPKLTVRHRGNQVQAEGSQSGAAKDGSGAVAVSRETVKSAVCGKKSSCPSRPGPGSTQVGRKLPCHGDRGNSAPRRPRGVTLWSRESTRTQTFERDGGLGAEAPGEVSSVPFREGGDDRGLAAARAEGTDLVMTDVQPQEAVAGAESVSDRIKIAPFVQKPVTKETQPGTCTEWQKEGEQQTSPAKASLCSKNEVTSSNEDVVTATEQNENRAVKPDSKHKAQHVWGLSPSKPVLSRPPEMIHSKLGRLGGTCEANRGFERQTDTARGTSASGNASAPGVLGTNSEGMLQVIDDCPPLPAPFEHRIVSAKQVPMSTYYTIKPHEVLGGGRFGQVHKCTERTSGLTLAAKIIKVKGMKDRDEVKNEICVMNQLDHVNLIQLYDAFESRTNLTLVMEYVEGGELFDRIVDDNYQLTELDTIVFMRQICEGVHYLHQQYILHLDLKPENILCVSTTGNQIKIIDFGLARNLSGLSPFLGDNDTETMNNILHSNWDFDADAFENVSEEAKDFVSRLLIPEKCSRLSASGCLKHSWLNHLEEKAKMQRVQLKSQLRLQRYLAAHRQWKKHFHVVAAANRLRRFWERHSTSTNQA
ncbi:myosin light chain kinase 3-like isoform X2 [Anguilla anguilla]|uniref:myosin light chain kinase 3-like isoform X2 n=1 Tax=Anguilla anguilla TaxID=7936 RepID=UPI0015AD5E56|nr:myosin light chain kinase 3-like isoform X2 [Anguilla anguilla]